LRAAPAVTVEVTCFSLWRSGLTCVSALASLSLALWLFGRHDPRLALLAVLVPWAVLWSLVPTMKPYRLAWDSGAWRVGELASQVQAPGQAARVSVAVDLGS